MNFNKTTELINIYVNELKLPYFSIIVKRNNKTIFQYAVNGTTNDLIRMYSMSKPITAVALLQLVEQGKVNLDDEVSKYLPSFKNVTLLNNNEPIKGKILIKHLLSMTSGMDYNLSREAIKTLLKNNQKANTVEICSTFVEDGIHFEPGERFQYSLSMDVAAAIIEIVSGQKFSQFVNDNIFVRLNMNSSSFANDKNLLSKCLKDYNYDSNTNELSYSDKVNNIFLLSDNYESGGAGLISTVEDYSKFIDCLANNNEKIISSKMLNELSTLRVSNTPFTKETNEFSKSNKEYGYGYGVRVRKIKSVSGIPEGEFGWDGAAGCYSLCDIKNNISITIGLNILNWPNYVKSLHIDISNSIYNEIELATMK